MAQFRFRMAPLLRLREAARDQRRRYLGEALKAEAMLQHQRKTTERQIELLRHEARDATAPGVIDVDRLLAAQRYEMTLRAQVALLDHQAKQLEAEIERRRVALVEADREVRVLEKLRERHWQRFLLEQARKDAKQMDEIAAQMFHRARSDAEGEEATP